MPITYYASHLTDNIGATPEGYLVCRDCVIARTGWQEYQVRDLPTESAVALGVDVSNPSAVIRLYREHDAVFSPATIASFEGKSVCDGHPPGEQFVGPSNVADFEYGHVQNVRKGEFALDSGDWPLVADLLIKRQPLIDRVKGGLRELSCGYDYTLARDGDRILQTSIRGNHVAVVPRGRAGAEARIKDSAPESQERKPAGDGSTGNTRKEKPVTNMLRHLLGLGLKAYAADAEPEKVAEAAEAVKAEEKAEPVKPKEVEEPAVKPAVKPANSPDDKPAEGKRADDKRADGFRKRRADDCRGRMHDQISRCEDSDLEELEEHLEQFFAEEADEPEHNGGEVEPVEEVEPAEDRRADDASAEDVDFYYDAANGKAVPIRGSKGYSKSKAGDPKKGRSRDSRASDEFIEPVEEAAAERADTAIEVLRSLRPVVARSNDKALRSAFNAALGKHTRSSKASDASYAGFAGAMRTRAADGTAGNGDGKELQSAYDQIYAGKKEGK